MNFQNSGTFSSNVGVIQVFSRKEFNSVGLGKPQKFSKIPTFLGGFKWGLYFTWFFFEKSCSNLVNQHFSSWEKYWLTKDWRRGFMTPFHSTGKADFCVLKIPCVLKIFSKPRRVKNSLATGVTCPFPGTGSISASGHCDNTRLECARVIIVPVTFVGYRYQVFTFV